MTDPGDDDDQDDGIYAGSEPVPDPWETRNEAFGVRMALLEAIQRVEDNYRERARPLLAQQARNPGVRLPALVELEQECADKIAALMKKHERAQELERAARRAPQHIATAHEHAVERASARAFAQDLGRYRVLRAEPERAGRDVRQTWNW